MTVTTHRRPVRGASRNTPGPIRNGGAEPRVIGSLKTPPSREELADLIRRMGVPIDDMTEDGESVMGARGRRLARGVAA